MDFSEGSAGRVFVLRLYGGEVLHESIENFSESKGIDSAIVKAVGGLDAGSKLTVGPKVPVEFPVEPQYHVLTEPHEFFGVGTIFRNADGPVLHMHGSCGRNGSAVTGCVRSGVIVWTVMEVVIQEITASAERVYDETTGFELMVPRRA